MALPLFNFFLNINPIDIFFSENSTSGRVWVCQRPVPVPKDCLKSNPPNHKTHDTSYYCRFFHQEARRNRLGQTFSALPLQVSSFLLFSLKKPLDLAGAAADFDGASFILAGVCPFLLPFCSPASRKVVFIFH